MFVHKLNRFAALSVLTILFLAGVIHSESINNANDNTLTDNDMTNTGTHNNPEQVEYMNLLPSSVTGKHGKLFEIENSDLSDLNIDRPVSFVRAYPKYSTFSRPARPVIPPIPNFQFMGDNVMPEARARRYAYLKGQNSQSFLRFGRAHDSEILNEKRPMKAKDTAFLRFGRSQL